MTPAVTADLRPDVAGPGPDADQHRADVAWRAFVALLYGAATALAAWYYHPSPDRLLTLAQQIVGGRLDAPAFAGTVDSVEVGGRVYMAVGPLQPLPYLPFVWLTALQPYAGYLIGAALGIATAWLALPLVRAHGAAPEDARRLATFVALGTLLFYVSVFGDLYYLAHVEAFLALTLFLVEWAGRRRPIVLGALIGIAFLARAPTVLAAIPFGLALIWMRPDWLRRGLAFAVPLVAALGVYAAYNWARFGSPLDAGHGISLLTDSALEARRALGVFSPAHVLENLRIAFLSLPNVIPSPPFLEPDPYGQSMLLVSPGLLLALRAGIREPAARVLWGAAALVAVPVFLYYGGGFVQYGFRYSLDFTPFLVSLVAMGARRGLGRFDNTLLILSIASVAYGVVWHVRGGTG